MNSFIITPEIEHELRAWMRPVSPMTAFIKTLRNEGPSDSPKADDPPKAVDPYADIDLDELPDNVRAAIEKSKNEFSTLQTDAAAAKEKAARAEHFARTVQSKADKLERVVRTHNLPVEGAPVAPTDPEAVLAEQFVKDGLKPEAAKIYAKMFATNNQQMEQRILGALGPLADTVGSIQADTLLASAKQTNATVFAIPAVEKTVRDNVSALVTKGQPVNEQTIEHLTQMAYGQYIMANPKALESAPQPGVPNFGRTMNTGVVPNMQTQQKTGPTATDGDTIRIMNSILPHLNQGLPSKKK